MDIESKDERGWAWLLALMLMVLVFFSPALHKTFIFRDAFNLFYPYKAVMAEGLRSFDVQLWNPWETLGSSFVGELATGWFYPGNVLYMVFPVDAAFRLYIVGHYLMAALFMWLMLREIRIGPAAAACGALSFTLSGYLLSQNGMPDMLVPCAWMPGTLWMLERYLKGRRVSWFILFSASLAMPFLAGRAEAILINGAVAAGWIIVTPCLSGAGQRMWSLVKVMPLAGVIAFLLSMVQFLPSYELGKLSMKGEGFPLEIATLWSFHPKRLLEFLLPSPFGQFWLDQNYTAWDLTGWEGHYPWSLSQYMGILILAGSLISAARASWKNKILIGGALLLVTFFSFGDNSFLYPLVHELLHPFRIFRYPGKYMAICVLILACAGAFGLDALISHLKSCPGRRLYFYLLMLALLFVLLSFARGVSPLYIENVPGVTYRSTVNEYIPVKHLFLFSIILIAIVMTCGFRSLRNIFGPAVLFLLFFDLSLANHWVIPYSPKEMYEFKPSALSIIENHSKDNNSAFFDAENRPLPGRFRVMREPVRPSELTLMMVEGGYHFESYRKWERHTLQPNFNFIHGIEELTGYTAAATADFDAVMKKYLNIKTMELFNTRYVISPAAGSWLEEEGLPLAGTKYKYGFKVFYLPDAFPRAYLMGRSVRVEKAMDSLELLETHGFRSAVVLEDHPELRPRDTEADVPLTPCEIVSYEPEEVKIKAHAPEPAYLVLSDSFFPGWEACIDGKPTTVFKANFLVRAVWVPEGGHEVVFKYNPLMYRAGRAVSLCAVLICFGIVMFDLYRSRIKTNN